MPLGRRVTCGLAVLALTACSRTRFATSSAPADAEACRPLPVATASAVGIEQAAIDSLQRAAEALKSDALLILRDGRLVHEWTSPGFRLPFNPQSVTKAITGLGVGVLLDRGRLPNLDVPLATFFPEFASDGRQAITLRHLMTHTSGLAAERGEAQFYASGRGDAAAYVRSRELAEPAGTTFRYSNVGAQLVSHVVQAASGTPLHAVLDSAVFAPLCIRDWRWALDERGATYGYSRIELTARDLAKLGQLVLDGGTWNGRRILRTETIDSLTMLHGGAVSELAPATFVGLWQFWGGDSVRLDAALRDRLRALPVSDSLLGVVERVGAATTGTAGTIPFQLALDSVFGQGRGVARWYAETGGRVMPTRWRTPAQVVGHSGSWGQWLLVFPETRTVVVRFASWDHEGREDENDGNDWPSLVRDAYRLVGRRPPTPPTP